MKFGLMIANMESVTLTFRYDRVTADGHVLMLDDVTHISGVTRELVIPREAMGRGDLKFLAAIGAFLGWRAVLFSLFAGSLLGSVIGLVTLVVGKPVWSAKLPLDRIWHSAHWPGCFLAKLFCVGTERCSARNAIASQPDVG